MWEGEVGWGRRQGEARRKGKKGKNGGTEGKCRRDKHASSLRSKEVANGEQDMTALWPGSERGWPVWMCCPPYVRLWASGKENMRGGKLRVQKVGFPLRVWCFCFAGSRHVICFSASAVGVLHQRSGILFMMSPQLDTVWWGSRKPVLKGRFIFLILTLEVFLVMCVVWVLSAHLFIL